MKQIASFISVKIKNFKSIKDSSFNLKKLNDVYGDNSTGKSSILEAIQFACFGKKSDVDKISVGAEKAEVEIEAVENDVPIKIKTTINKKGDVYCRAKVNDIVHNQPKALIKRLLSFGAFNPREMLDKKGRLERLLQLVPIQITEKDLSVPEMQVESFPIADPGSIDYSKHAFVVLQALDKDLRNSRWSKGREKDMMLKSYEKRKQDFDNSVLVFQRNYNGSDPLSFNKTFEEEVREQERLKLNLRKLLGEKASAEDYLDSAKQRKKMLEDSITYNNKAIDSFKDQIKAIQEKIRDAEKEGRVYSEGLTEETHNVNMYEEKISKIRGEITTNEAKVNETDERIKMADSSTNLKKINDELEKEHLAYQVVEKDWKSFDHLVKKVFPVLQRKVLGPIKEKIPGLELEGDDFTYKGVPIDTLSGSEIVTLGLKLMSLQENCNLLLINEAECLDKDSFAKANFDDFGSVIVARVGDSPLGGKWNPIKMKKEVSDGGKTNGGKTNGGKTNRD